MMVEVAQMTASPALFRLAELSLVDASQPSFPKLPTVDVRFTLPPLDEHESGSERMIAAIHTRSSFKALYRSYAEVEAVDDNSLQEGQGLENGVEGREEQDLADLWYRAGENAEAGPSRPRAFQPLKTWDTAHCNPPSETRRTTFLSEDHPSLYEAMITSSDPTVNLPKLAKSSETTPPTFDLLGLLHLMMRATLGTTSTDALKWGPKQSRFVWSEGGGRGLGTGAVTSLSAIEPFLRIATGLRRLEIIVDDQSTALLTPTHHALLHGVSNYLTFIKDRLRTAVDENETEHTAKWIKWSSMLKDLGGLLEALCDVMCWPLSSSKAVALPSKSSNLLTHIYAHLLANLQTSSSSQVSPTSLALAYLMTTSSQPFLNLLHQWLGLKESELDISTDPSTQPWSDLGIIRVPVAHKENTTDCQLSWEYEFTSRRMPGFIPRETRRLLFEAGRSLRLLRDASGGQHPLCAGSWVLETNWGWGEGAVQRQGDIKAHVKQVNKEIGHWRRSVRDRARPLSGSATSIKLRSSRKVRMPLPVEFTLPPLSPPSSVAESTGPLTTDEDIFLAMLAQVEAKPGGGSSLWTASDQTSLQSFIAHHSVPSHPLLPEATPNLPLYITTHLLGPLATHSELVSTSLVSLYLDDLKFLDHLDVLRAFWLGGDSGFFERVSGALFGKEEAGSGEGRGLGRRARTRVRMGLGGGDLIYREDEQGVAGSKDEDWGMGLGVGLSERERWPPGGGELAYALRTTLLDENGFAGSAGTEGKERGGSVWEEIEDRVSFAIKDLPDDEADGRRARWLNPQAVEALDFLYLAYSPPPTISILLPQTLMEKYQTIQNFLLRISRTQKVLDTLFLDLVHLPPPTSLKDTTQLEKECMKLRFRMVNFVSGLGRYVIDTAISSNWEVMKRRLDRLKTRVRDHGGDTTRPSTPVGEREGDDLDLLQDDFYSTYGDDINGNDDEEGEDEGKGGIGGGTTSINQLKSIHSLVTYHHLTLDRILRSCLLADSAGYQVTFKVLMGLLGLVLDFGKTVKLLHRGKWDYEEGLQRVKSISSDWIEKEHIFMHALERLSLRTTNKELKDVEKLKSGGTERDLQVLLDGEGGDDDLAVRLGHGGGGGDLAELVSRLNLGHGDVGRKGRWADV